MPAGLLSAVLVSVIWITFQNVLMHWRPLANRFKVMLCGFLLSLPFVYLLMLLLQRLQIPSPPNPVEHWCLAPIHAYILHLLLFFLYVEVFYHIERSVTLRFLIELRSARKHESLESVRRRYSLQDMIQGRLDALEAGEFIEARNRAWYNRPKGRLVAKLAAISLQLFPSQIATERIGEQ